MTSVLSPILNQPSVSRVRRNHGLEHATIHLLARKFPKTPLAGHSDSRGFWIMGDVSAEDIAATAEEALSRMRSGEHELAIHPNCGTNFVATGSLAGLLGAAAMFGSGRRLKDKLERLPLAMTLATLGLIFAQPFGYYLQEHVTTSGKPGALEIVQVRPAVRGRIRTHRVVTRG